MKTEKPYLEILALLGVVGLVAFLMNAVFSQSSPEGFVLLVNILASFAMVVGLAAGLGLLVVDRITSGQAEILKQLAALKSAQTAAMKAQ